MFPVITANEFRLMLDKGQDSSKSELVDLKYSDCSIEIGYDPVTGNILFINQNVYYTATVEDGYKNGEFKVMEKIEYSNFVY